MMIRSKAPLRISFAGGGTDVMPYLAEQGGAVLSTTINHYAYASLKITSDQSVVVKSLDYDLTVKHDLKSFLPYDGNLDLIKAVINRLHLQESAEHAFEDNYGIEVFLHSDAPPGSGLGSSSTLVVCLIALFRRYNNLPLTDYEIADLAYQIERVDMAIKGGKQDQYAATFGGFNFIEFYDDATIVNPLRIDPDVLNELDYNLLLCYTGKTRLSSHIIDTQVKNYQDKNIQVMAAMKELKQITIDLKNALLRGRLNDFGALLNEAWRNKKMMADEISTSRIDELYEAAISSGALGGKITGAGGGGYMFFYCPFDTKRNVALSLEKLGAQVVDFTFDFHGVQTWTAR
jgi:D-glycero-alpha-D-manno-heptose-7-phosphate kinase